MLRVEKLYCRACYVTIAFSSISVLSLFLVFAFSFLFSFHLYPVQFLFPGVLRSSFFVLQLPVPCSRSKLPVFPAVPLLFVSRSMILVLYFKFPVPRSLFPGPCSSLPVPCSLLSVSVSRSLFLVSFCLFIYFQRNRRHLQSSLTVSFKCTRSSQVIPNDIYEITVNYYRKLIHIYQCTLQSTLYMD